MRRLLVLCLVLAACGGGTSAGDGSRPGFALMGSGSEADLPPALDVLAQTRLVLTDDDLPADLRYLVVGLATSTGTSEPPFFETGEWVVGVARTYRPDTLATQVIDVPGLRDTGLAITSGTMAFGSAPQAEEAFVTGLDAARSDRARITRISRLGDAAALIEFDSDGPVRQIVVRRGPVLVSVSATAVGEADLPDEDALVALAGSLDVRTAAALDATLEPVAPHVLLASAPALQLNSYEFSMESTYGFQAGDQTIRMTGFFEAPDEQECTVIVDGVPIVTVIGDGTGLATEQSGGWRYLDEDSARQLDAGCLGSSAYFDGAVDMFDEASYIGFDESFEFDLETVNGVETRRYGIEDVSFAALFEEVGRLDEFDIWFDARDGWPVRLRIAGVFSSETIRGPGILGTQDAVPTTIEIDISRPNDSDITVDVPDEIGIAATGV
jgi:hypothetical protein